MSTFNLENLDVLEVSAQPRDTTRRDWLRHAGTIAGFFALGGVATRALAQTDTPTMAPAMSGSSYNSIVNDPKPNPNHPNTVIPKAAKEAAPSDADILNFALGLEYLEADFYARVVAAHQARPYLTPRVFEVAQKLAMDEAEHVRAILDILGRANVTPVNKPQFQFPEKAFQGTLAFLDTATMFEETGVSAYLGQAPNVRRKDVLNLAASIYGNEARHTGLIRFLMGDSIAAHDVEVPMNMGEILNRIRPFIVSLNMDSMPGTDTSGTDTSGMGTAPAGTTP